jgi:hypothetical protein
MITGTVTDQSPGGRLNVNSDLEVPLKGTPAISDADQGAWMKYVYMQQSKPANATGVEVHLTATDPNGNFQDIGTVTSDNDGSYAFGWSPPVTGIYKVTATFAGSNSYYGSYGTTHFIVGKAPAAAVVTPAVTPAPTQTQTTAPTVAPTAVVTVAPTPSPVVIPPTSAAPITTYIAIGVVVIVIIAAAAALILRRRK